jgi:hypothetical protein
MSTGQSGRILQSEEFEILETHNLIVLDPTDPTKKFTFDLSAVASDTTVTLTIPSASGSIGGGLDKLVQNVAQGTIAIDTVVKIHTTTSFDVTSDRVSIALVTAVTDTAYGLTSASFPVGSSQTLIGPGLNETSFNATAVVNSPIFFTSSGALSETPTGSMQIGVLVTTGANAKIYFTFPNPGSSHIESGGTAALPSIAVDGDSTSGIYSTGVGVLQASVGAVELFKLEAANHTVTLGSTHNIKINDLETRISGPTALGMLDAGLTTLTDLAVSGVIQLPNFTSSERDNLTAIQGQIMFNSTTTRLNFYNGTRWKSLQEFEVLYEPFLPTYSSPPANSGPLSAVDAEGQLCTISASGQANNTDYHFAHAFNGLKSDYDPNNEGFSWVIGGYNATSGLYSGLVTTYDGASTAPGHYLAIEFSQSPKSMYSYTIFNSDEAAYSSEKWIVLGSNNYTTWDSMHTEYTATGAQLSAYAENTVICTNTTAYLHYRLVVTKTVSGPVYNSIVEWEPKLYDTSPTRTS